MFNKIKNKITAKQIAIASAVGSVGFALSAYGTMAATPSATSTLDTIAGSIITTTVDLMTTVFTTYWPYVLVIGILSGLVALFMRFSHLGTGHGRK